MNYKVKTRKVKNSEQLKKRKITENADIYVSPKQKPNKLSKSQKEEDNNLVEDESLSEDGQCQSSVERSALVSFYANLNYSTQQEYNISILTAEERKINTCAWEGRESKINNQSLWNEVCASVRPSLLLSVFGIC